MCIPGRCGSLIGACSRVGTVVFTRRRRRGGSAPVGGACSRAGSVVFTRRRRRGGSAPVGVARFIPSIMPSTNLRRKEPTKERIYEGRQALELRRLSKDGSDLSRLGSLQCPHSAHTVPTQCPHSARTVPAQCPHSARCKFTYF